MTISLFLKIFLFKITQFPSIISNVRLVAFEMYKIVSDQAPPLMREIFFRKTEDFTRSNSRLYRPRVNTIYRYIDYRLFLDSFRVLLDWLFGMKCFHINFIHMIVLMRFKKNIKWWRPAIVCLLAMQTLYSISRIYRHCKLSTMYNNLPTLPSSFFSSFYEILLFHVRMWISSMPLLWGIVYIREHLSRCKIIKIQ